MLVFLVVMTAVVGGLSYYLGARLIPGGWSPAARTAAWIAVAALVAIQPLAFVIRFVFRAQLGGDALSWVAFLAMGLFAITFGFTALRDLFWLAAKLLGQLPVDEDRRRALLEMTNVGVMTLVSGTFAFGVARALSRPGVVDVSVPIKDLPQGLDGFRIVQISDVHVGPTIKRGFIDAVVETVNRLEADLVAVTGDLVDGSVEELREHTAPLSNLKARHGAWFVTGNHEYYSGVHAWIDEVERLGIKALVNTHDVIEHDGHKIVVAGVTDITAHTMVPEHRSDPHKAVADAPSDAVLRVLLAHQPRSAYEAEKAGYHLQLSGHTHGGQFFPGTWLIKLVQPFVAGLHRHKEMWVYTNRGTGYWGPPVRTTDAPEVTRITLRRA